MLLDVQGAINAIQKTMNELKKLSDEEYVNIPKDCYLRNIYCADCDLKKSCGSDSCGDYENWKEGYEKGLSEGKPKWHDLRENPNDLPKCSEKEQIIFYVQEYYKSIDKYKKHYCLGFYKKSFMNDDVKLFVERSKGYECEHSIEDVFWWCELPKFEE